MKPATFIERNIRGSSAVKGICWVLRGKGDLLFSVWYELLRLTLQSKVDK
jgi:hypothetical protein